MWIIILKLKDFLLFKFLVVLKLKDKFKKENITSGVKLIVAKFVPLQMFLFY